MSKSLFSNSEGTACPEAAVLNCLILLAVIGFATILGRSAHSRFQDVSGNLTNAFVIGSLEPQAVVDAAGEHRSAFADNWFIPAACAVLGTIAIFLISHRKAAEKRELEEKEMSSDIFDKRQRAYRVLSQQAETLLHNEVTVAALMSTKMQCVSPKTKIAKLRGIMQKQHMHHILVCESERILGVISDRDLNRWQQSEGYAEKMMTTKPLVTYPEVLLTTAITQMLTHRISCLPVVDSDARIVGILTSTDILIGFQAVLRTTSEMMTTLVDVTDIAIGEDVRTPSKEDNHVPVNLPKVSGQ